MSIIASAAGAETQNSYSHLLTHSLKHTHTLSLHTHKAHIHTNTHKRARTHTLTAGPLTYTCAQTHTRTQHTHTHTYLHTHINQFWSNTPYLTNISEITLIYIPIQNCLPLYLSLSLSLL